MTIEKTSRINIRIDFGVHSHVVYLPVYALVHHLQFALAAVAVAVGEDAEEAVKETVTLLLFELLMKQTY